MAKGLRELLQFADNVQEALDEALAEHITVTQSKLSQASPIDSGRFASSWFVSVDGPELGTRPPNWAEPGAKREELSKYPKSSITYDGTWYISNNLPYGPRLADDPKWGYGGRRGSSDWYNIVTTQQPYDLEETFRKFLRRV